MLCAGTVIEGSIAEDSSVVVSGASGERAEQRSLWVVFGGIVVQFLAMRAASWFAGHLTVDFDPAGLADKATLHKHGNSHDKIAHGGGVLGARGNG